MAPLVANGTLPPGSPPTSGLQGAAGSGGSSSAGAAGAPALAQPPARVIRAHTQRPLVSRSVLQHIAKVFGVHLKGDVATNEITTAKYTLLTFLPVNLFEQFLRVANLYFLLTAILQLIPGLSPTSWVTTVLPLGFVLAVNAIKEAYDDVHRHRNDNQINNRKVVMLVEGVPGGEMFVAWRDVVAGDLLKVREGEEVPADLVLLSTPDPEDLCYVETANLDGETNLKIKYCWRGQAKSSKVEDFVDWAATCYIGCEAPNPKLYVFDGFVGVNDDRTGARKEALDTNNLLLRGSTLCKTEWAIGVAVNVGTDTKIVQNMTRAARKVTQLEKHMNLLVAVMFMALLVFSVLLSGLNQWWEVVHSEDNAWYLRTTGTYPELPPGGLGWVVMLLRYIILLSNLIPISLYVSLEVVKVFQCALLLNPDRRMYHAETDTPFMCRTTTLNEELGQVQYVLSDKTGTLTQNVMGFVWASIGGKLYGRSVSRDGMRLEHVPSSTPHTIALDADMHRALGLFNDKPPAPDAHEFLVNLAVCNTVVPSVGSDGQLQYQASSPDEEALVQGAAYLGYRLVSRTGDQVQVEQGGRVLTWDVLAVLEFSSDRKRMSLIARTPDDRIMLYSKGADSIMYTRLAPGQALAPGVQEHLDEMARGGFRTLVVAQRELTRAEYSAWAVEFQAASVSMVEREERVAEVGAAIETKLRLLGATAVEDKLQDGVPECLQALSAAGIKVWVLTGDKVETAISIAYSCKLFTEDMAVVELREVHFNGHTDESGAQVLNAKHKEVEEQNRRLGMRLGATAVGIVIEGGALAVALAPANQDAFMALCRDCRSVVCCRVSPMQKAQVTNMVKKKAGAITLGIGDGANDVGMVRAAHIGVGISGREGRAAVLASDFSFAQFRFLSRLLLLHGRSAYLRNREVVLYSFYKNWAYCLVFMYLNFQAGFSAVPIFTTMLISVFNMIFTACPIVAYAVLEQDLEPSTVLAHPATYGDTRTQRREDFFTAWLVYMMFGAWHSLPCYFLPWYTLSTPDRSGRTQDLASSGTAVFVALILAVTLKLAWRTHHWSWITHLIYWASIGLVLPYIAILSIMWPLASVSGVSDMTGVAADLFGGPVFWLGAVVCAPAIALLPDMATTCFRRHLRPGLTTLLQEAELGRRLCDRLSVVERGSPQTRMAAMADSQRDQGRAASLQLAGSISGGSSGAGGGGGGGRARVVRAASSGSGGAEGPSHPRSHQNWQAPGGV